MARGPLAGAAGPGKFSVRTDGLTLPSAAYGEGVETAAIKAGASMARTPDVRGVPASAVRAAAAEAPLTPLYAETQRQDEPITTGIGIGDGAGEDALMMNQMQQDSNRDKDFLAKYMPMLQTMAASPDSSESFRIFARNVQSLL
jgi:hypothetical protein